MALLLICSLGLSAKEMIGFAGKMHDAKKTASDCSQATALTELNINNVRTALMTGGDLWWDLSNARYEVPKVEPGSGIESAHAIFAGALWIGGFDALGQLKVAAQTYRQSGNDFYPGPLDFNGETNADQCSEFDKFWEVKGFDINQYLAAYAAGGGEISEADVPTSVLLWPGRNNDFAIAEFDGDFPLNKDLAPFWDANNDDEYNPLDGDYPVIDPDVEGVFADQMIWWVFNDKGNAHTETGGEAIGLEIRGLAFAFATNDEVNNMTFYKYVVENNSSVALDSTFFAQWVDPDLGQYDNDYVGCDTTTSMGIVYNGTEEDTGAGSYGTELPMLGVDFFQGPKKPIVNAEGETEFIELGMSSFLFYNNDFSVTGNPETVSHYYGYMAGQWKDGEPFTFGGNGKGGTDVFPYMFPDDPLNPNGWSECAEEIEPADRRFLQAAGPFRLDPGVVNDVIVGVVWVPDVGGCGSATFTDLINADKKAQALFDNNFKLVDGPDAPNMSIRELDQKLILSIFNDESSNNFNESYSEADPVLTSINKPDSLYKFQGYRIYQLKTANVSPSEYDDPTVAREIFTVDIQDGITRIINFVEDPNLESTIPQLMVDASDSGIKNTFVVDSDQFAPGDKSLVNHNRYYFSAVTYAYNAYQVYDPNVPLADLNAQKNSYLAGRNNVKVYTAIPHQTSNGQVLNAEFGESPQITQISGYGNGCQELELTQETKNEILTSGGSENQVYMAGNGPINVKISDPSRVPSSSFELRMINSYFTDLPETTDMGGTIAEAIDGSIVYTPNADFDKGYDHFNYTVTNLECSEEIGSVVINYKASNFDFPGAFDDTENVGSGNNVVINPFSNDVVKNANIKSFTTPGAGEVVQTGNTLSYTSTGGAGIDVFRYTIVDTMNNGDLKESSAAIYVNVRGEGSESVVAADDIFEIEEGGPLNVFENDEVGLIASGLRLTNNATWELTDLTTGVVYESENTIKNGSEQAIGGWVNTNSAAADQEPLGFTIGIAQATTALEGNALINSDIVFENVQSRWLSVVPDGEAPAPNNWILSGEGTTLPADYAYDRNEYYENIAEKGLAPYCLTNVNADELGARYVIAPGCSDCYLTDNNRPTNTLGNLHSVDIVFTDDKANWTKCPVIEMSREFSSDDGIFPQGENGGRKNSLRRSPNLNQDGSTAEPISITEITDPEATYFILGSSSSYIEMTIEYSSAIDSIYTDRDEVTDTIEAITKTSADALTQTIDILVPMNSFFSAENFIKYDAFKYNQANKVRNGVKAILFETEQLFDIKIIKSNFGPDLKIYNANDFGMGWFPGYAINIETGERLNMFFSENSELRDANGADMMWNPTSTFYRQAGFDETSSYRIGGEHYIYVMSSNYDEGVEYQSRLINYDSGAALANASTARKVKKAVYDEALWVAVSMLSQGAELKSFADGVIPSDIAMKVRVKYPYTAESIGDPLVYQFDMAGYAPTTKVQNEEFDILADANVVPNPYYAFSTYENNKLDNRVKLTNLPARAEINIFSLDGTLIRRLEIDNTGLDTGVSTGNGTIENAIDWDLKNHKGIPIASGMYIIHIKDPDSGAEKTLKWFGFIRPVDLDTF